MFRRTLGIVAAALVQAAHAADPAKGEASYVPAPCGDTLFDDLTFVCKSLQSLEAYGAVDLGGFKCGPAPGRPNACVVATQELFTGIEFTGVEFAGAAAGGGARRSANPKFSLPGSVVALAPKAWNGLGGQGVEMQDAAICLARDLETAPISAEASFADAPVDLSLKQAIRFTHFDPKGRRVEGYHSARLKAPLIGDIELVRQKFQIAAVDSNVMPLNARALDRRIASSHAVLLEAEGAGQSLLVELPSIQVSTPVGPINIKPEMFVGRSAGWVIAPYSNGADPFKRTVFPPPPDGALDMRDVYGRLGGLDYVSKVGGAAAPIVAPVIDKVVLSGNEFVSVAMIRGAGWTSDAGLGSRDPSLSGKAWTLTDSEDRPDADFSKARNDAEKLPTASAIAGADVRYSPLNLLPASIRNNPYIDIEFEIFVKPAIGVQGSSQLHLAFEEGGYFEIGEHETEPGPAPKEPIPGVKPGSLVANHADEQARFSMRSGAQIAAAIGMTGGLDLKVVLDPPVISSKTLVNKHPRFGVVAYEKTSGVAAGDRSAMAISRFGTGKSYAAMTRLTGGALSDGGAFIKACYAAQETSVPIPEEPYYQPGGPEEILEITEIECNICVGLAEDETFIDALGKPQKIEKFYETILPATNNPKPPALQTKCMAAHHIGCHDVCRVNWDKVKAGGDMDLTVTWTAAELAAKGNADYAACSRP
ncbi:MAG: hypothetical protein ACK4NP_10415 [Parvularculaceae bacterium]